MAAPVQWGTTGQLVSGTLTMFLPTAHRWWYLQNQDAAPLTVTFSDGTFGTSLILTAAQGTGYPGGYLDSYNFPYYGSVTLSSTVASHKFGSGSAHWTARPENFFSNQGFLIAGLGMEKATADLP